MFTIESSVVSIAQGDNRALLDYSRGVYFGLDEVAGLIWDGLCAGLTLDAIADSIVNVYDADKAIVSADIMRLLEKMVAFGLVTRRA